MLTMWAERHPVARQAPSGRGRAELSAFRSGAERHSDVRRAPFGKPDPSEQGVDEYLYYLASTEVLAGLTTFPTEAWARQLTTDPTTDLVKIILWEVVGAGDTSTWRRRWDDAGRI